MHAWSYGRRIVAVLHLLVVLAPLLDVEHLQAGDISRLRSSCRGALFGSLGRSLLLLRLGGNVCIPLAPIRRLPCSCSSSRRGRALRSFFGSSCLGRTTSISAGGR